MTAIAIAFLLVAMIGVAVCPRPVAALPFLAGACYLPTGLTIELGPFHFYALRTLLVIALARMLLKREGLATPLHGLDRMMLAWAVVALASSLFYQDVAAALVMRMGMVFTACGTYFVCRVFCRSADDVTTLCRIIAVVLMPVALAMFIESLTGRNQFSAFGGVDAISVVRNGAIRAQGPFSHPILAGSVGAASFPLMLTLWKSRRTESIAGMLACLTMVFTAASSGPLLSIGFAVVALFMWPVRHHMRFVRWMLVLGYLFLELVMNAPAYYVLAHIDLTGSSTSWHRAALIEAAIAHWSEWWLAGTSYTRHWMPYGVPWSPNHSDITNHYLRMGVDGGLLLMLLFVGVLTKGFSLCGQFLRQPEAAQSMPSFVAWALGASLFAHAATFMSVSYFDQSVMFLYFTLAAIGSAARNAPMTVADVGVPMTGMHGTSPDRKRGYLQTMR